MLCDVDREATRAYGLLHQGGGPDGGDIAIPAHILINQNGRIVRRYVSARIQERLSPDDVLRAVRELRPNP